MNAALGHDAALQGYIGLGQTWANEMNFGIMPEVQERLLDLMTCSPVCYGCQGQLRLILINDVWIVRTKSWYYIGNTYNLPQ